MFIVINLYKFIPYKPLFSNQHLSSGRNFPIPLNWWLGCIASSEYNMWQLESAFKLQIITLPGMNKAATAFCCWLLESSTSFWYCYCNINRRVSRAWEQQNRGSLCGVSTQVVSERTSWAAHTLWLLWGVSYSCKM